MTIAYNLAPNGRWTARESTGVSARFGKVYTWRNQTRIPKATYQDPTGLVENTNPVELDSSGAANIYWADDEYYTIEVYAEDGQLIYTEDNYPVIGTGGGGGDIIINETFENVVLNNQFLRWGNNDFNKDATSTTVYTRLGTQEVLLDSWFFKRSNNNTTNVVSQQQFNVGQTQVPGNPINYVNFQCTAVGSGAETFKAIYQPFPSAQLFSNTEISFSIWAMSSTSDPLNIYIEQFFGTGGSPSATVTTTVATSITLTSEWTQYTGQVTVPSVAGKVFGSNGDDSLNLCIGLPLNVVSNSSYSAVQLNQGNELVTLPTTTVWDQLLRNTQTTLFPTFYTGDYVLTLSNVFRPGWLQCNDSTIGSSFSGASNFGNRVLPLFLTLWNNVSSAYVPIFDSAGNPSNRGVSAIADFNADKRLQLTSTLGRVLGSAGSGSGLTPRVLGQTAGAETVTLVPGNLPPHLHSYTNHSASSVSRSYQASSGTAGAQVLNTTDGSDHGLSSTPFGIMQPTLFLNCFIKL